MRQLTSSSALALAATTFLSTIAGPSLAEHQCSAVACSFAISSPAHANRIEYDLGGPVGSNRLYANDDALSVPGHIAQTPITFVAQPQIAPKDQDARPAKGSGVISCQDQKGAVDAQFEGLVPGAVYALWQRFEMVPPPHPEVGAYFTPLLADGETAARFVADADGVARISQPISECPRLSGQHFATELVVVMPAVQTMGGATLSDAHVLLHAPLRSPAHF